MHSLSIYGIIRSFCSESVDFQYFQLSQELPSAKIKEHTKTHVSQPFGLPIPGGIPSVGREREAAKAGGWDWGIPSGERKGEAQRLGAGSTLFDFGMSSSNLSAFGHTFVLQMSHLSASGLTCSPKCHFSYHTTPHPTTPNHNTQQLHSVS